MAHCKIEMEKLTVPGFPTTARWTAAATSSSPTVEFRYVSLGQSCYCCSVNIMTLILLTMRILYDKTNLSTSNVDLNSLFKSPCLAHKRTTIFFFDVLEIYIQEKMPPMLSLLWQPHFKCKILLELLSGLVSYTLLELVRMQYGIKRFVLKLRQH